MSEKLILLDAFARANTSVGAAGTTTGVGNNWTDVAGNNGSIVSNQLNLALSATANYFNDPIARPATEKLNWPRMIWKAPTDSGNTSPIARLCDNGSGYFLGGWVSVGKLSIAGFAGSSTPVGLVQSGSVLTTASTTYVYQLDATISGSTVTLTMNVYSGSCYIDPTTCTVLVTSGGAAATSLGSINLSTSVSQYLTPGHASIAPVSATANSTVAQVLIADSSPPTSSISPASAAPGTTAIGFTYTVTNGFLTSSSSLTLTGGTGASIASQTSNYTASPQTITGTFIPGTAAATLTFTDNTADAGTATVTVSVRPPD